MRYERPDTFTDKMFYMFDSVIQHAARAFKRNPKSFIDLETVENDHTMVMRDSTLLTALRIDGASTTMGNDEFVHALEDLERRIDAYSTSGIHYFSFWFHFDPDGGSKSLAPLFQATKASARHLELDLNDLLDEQHRVMSPYCHYEEALLLIWTTPAGLSRAEASIDRKDRNKARIGLPRARDAQDLACAVSSLTRRHDTIVEKMHEDLQALNIATTVLDKHEFLKVLRGSIDPEYTSDDWRASLPGDPVAAEISMEWRADMSNALWPKLSEQLFPRAPEHYDTQKVAIGNTLYAPLTVKYSQKDPKPFHSLFIDLKEGQVPWRAHFLIRNDGLSIFRYRIALAILLRVTPAVENKYIIAAKDYLEQLRDSGENIVKFQMSLCTWGPLDQPDLVERRQARLVAAVQAWGGCDVETAEGDALETMMCSTPGGTLGSVANITAMPLYEALRMCPISRPASRWNKGSVVFRTNDGKVMPRESITSYQSAQLTLVCGPMRFGKSVIMAYLNAMLILDPANREIPYVSILDIGPSSSGLISLLYHALPKSKRHYVMYELLKNTVDYAINPLDTPLGLRFPLSHHLVYLRNLMDMLMMPDDGTGVPDGADGFCIGLIEYAYKVKSERKTSNLYQALVLPEVDKLLEDLGFEFTDNSKWWDVVDFLFSKGYTREAGLAQRYAVPDMRALISLAKDSRITSAYQDTKAKVTDESLGDYVARKLTEATTKYPMLSVPTRFDIGEARVISLNLEEVTAGKGPAAERRAGVMYLLGYHVLTSRFFLDEDSLKEMDGGVGIYNIDYRPHHQKVIGSLRRMTKRFCIDEVKRVRSIKPMVTQIDQAIVEGPKRKIEIMQASQFPDDFSATSREVATNKYIIGSLGRDYARKLADVFNLGPTVLNHIYNLRRPNRHGARFIALSSTDKGEYAHSQVCTLGPTFLWACASNRDDAYVRDKLYGELGAVTARELLADLYPGGNIDDEVQRRREILESQSNSAAYAASEDLSGKGGELGETPESILDEIADSILEVYKARRAA